MSKEQPPFNIEAEKILLGGVLINPECLKWFDLEPSDFWLEEHQYIYQAMLKLGDGAGRVPVAHELVKMNKLNAIGGASYLISLETSVASSVSIEYYAKIIKDCSFHRRLISIGEQIQILGFKNGVPEDSLFKAQSYISQIGRELKDDSILMPSELAEKAMKHYESIYRQAPGIATGIYNFDEKTGGFLKGEYIILAGRGGMGKTTLALKIARYMAKKINTLFISLEMSAQAVTDKNVAALIGKPPKLITRGNYSDDTMGAINMAVGRLSEINLPIAEGNRDTASLRRLLDKYANTYGVGAIFIDYLQKFTDRYGGNQNERVAYISNELSQIPKDYKCPLITLCQLNRAPDRRDDKRPELSDLRESGAIEQDADMVLFVYRDSYYERLEQRPKIENTELIVAKDRLRGTYGSVNMDWDNDKEAYV